MAQERVQYGMPRAPITIATVGSLLVLYGCGVPDASFHLDDAEIEDLRRELQEGYNPRADGWTLDVRFDPEVLEHNLALLEGAVLVEKDYPWPGDPGNLLNDVYELAPSLRGVFVANHRRVWRVTAHGLEALSDELSTTWANHRVQRALAKAMVLISAELVEQAPTPLPVDCLDEHACLPAWAVGGIASKFEGTSLELRTVDRTFRWTYFPGESSETHLGNLRGELAFEELLAALNSSSADQVVQQPLQETSLRRK